jgi:hypothetical protein
MPATVRACAYYDRQSARGHSRRQASIGFGCLRRKYDMAQATFYPQTLADHLPIALVLRQSG